MRREVSFRMFLIISIILVIMSVSITTLLLNNEKIASITGLATGIARVNVTAIAMISLPASTVDFGTVSAGSTDDTEDDNPAPMLIQNDGGVKVDVTIAKDLNSTALFSGTGGGDNSSSFQFKADHSPEHDAFVPGQSQTKWANVPGTTPVLVIKSLKFEDKHDTVEVDLKINVPSDETPGMKTETLNFIASQS